MVRLLVCLATAFAAFASLPVAQASDLVLEAIVAPTIGVEVGTDAQYTGAKATTPLTVTRVLVGETVVVTVVGR